jgi:hypothetical protein
VLTLAFDAIYLCCLDALSLDGAAFDAIEHPAQSVLAEGARVLQLADDDVADAQRLLTWCLTSCEHGTESPLESGTAKDAVALAERVFACAVDFIAKNHD